MCPLELPNPLQIYMGENWNEFRETLDANPALLELARNPFFLRSMIRIYSPEMLVIENRGMVHFSGEIG